MALTFRLRSFTRSTTGTTVYSASPTYTPAANSLLVAFVVGCGDNADPNHATQPFTGHGVTWTKKALTVGGGGAGSGALSTTHALSVWVATAGASPTSAAATARWTTARTGCAIVEYEVTDYDASLGIQAVLSAITSSGTGTQGLLFIGTSYPSPVHPDNRAMALFVHLANELTNPGNSHPEADPSTWYEDFTGGDGSFASPDTGVETQVLEASAEWESAVYANWATSSAWRGIALEIASTTALTMALGVGALGLAGHHVAPSFQMPDAGALTISGTTPSVNNNASGAKVPAVGELRATGQAPTFSITGSNPTAAPSTAALAVTGQAPFPAIGGGTITPASGGLAFSGHAPSITLALPDAGALAIAGQAPTASISGPGSTAALPVGALSLSGQYVTPSFEGPDVGALTLSGTTPTLTSDKKLVPTGALALSSPPYCVATTVAMTAGAITASGAAPTLSVDSAFGVLPTGALAITGQAPTAAVAGSDTSLFPDGAALGLAGQTPFAALDLRATVSPSVGGLAFSGNAPTFAVSESDIALLINGVDVTSRIQVGTLRFTDDLNSRNTLTCTLFDRAGTFHPQPGDAVVLYEPDRVTKLFAGTMEEPEEVSYLSGDLTPYFIRISAVDYNQLADRKLVVESYDDTDFATIVNDIVATHLAPDGVVVSSIDPGPTFVRKVFNYRTVAEALNELARDTGYAWWIDYDKAFHFRARTSISAPFAVTLTNGTALTISVRRSRSGYVNRRWVRAGTDMTDQLTERFMGDGQVQTFTTGLPIGEEPTVRVDGVLQTVGIREVEDETAFDWYWNKGRNELTQRRAAVPLSDSQTLEIVYRGMYPLIVQAQDDAEISSRAAVEGGTGLYESIETLADIDSADLAVEAAVSKLARDGRIKTSVRFETDLRGLRSGQLIRITLPKHNIDGEYLIRSVSGQDVKGLFLRYSVVAIDGDSVGGWVEFYQRLMSQRRDNVQRENEKINMLRSMTQVVACGDSVVVDDNVARETRVGFAQVGRSVVGEY